MDRTSYKSLSPLSDMFDASSVRLCCSVIGMCDCDVIMMDYIIEVHSSTYNV